MARRSWSSALPSDSETAAAVSVKQLVDQPVEERQEERLLVGEGLIEVPVGERGLGADVLDAGRAVAVGAEPRQGRAEQAPAARLGALGGGDAGVGPAGCHVQS